MRKLLKKQGFAPDVLVTDKLRSYGAARSEIGLSARHGQGLRGHRHVAMRRAPADHKGVRIFMRPRRPRATCSSPRRGARGVIEPR